MRGRQGWRSFRFSDVISCLVRNCYVRSRGEPASSSSLNADCGERGRELRSSPPKSTRLSRDSPSATLEQFAALYVVCSICYIEKAIKTLDWTLLSAVT